jgi:hypothetical protein
VTLRALGGEEITSPTLREVADRPIWVGPLGQCELRLPRRAVRRFLGLHLPTRLRERHALACNRSGTGQE